MNSSLQKNMSEKKVLKQLGIDDFRHLSKDNVMKFASLLPKMDPEVAKKALDQFPEYKESVTEMIGVYKQIIEKGLTDNETNQQAYYSACNRIMDELSKQLSDENLSFEERQKINDKLIYVTQMMGGEGYRK